MNNLVTFNFTNNAIRTSLIDNEPYFCLKDCAKALGIKDCTDRAFEKGAENISTLTKGGMQKITFINEPNLYRLVFRSRKPQAQAFADWVYSEVLPSIRKTGGYGVDVSKKEIPALPTPDADLKDWCAQAMALMIENRARMAVDEERKQILNQMKNLLDKG